MLKRTFSIRLVLLLTFWVMGLVAQDIIKKPKEQNPAFNPLRSEYSDPEILMKYLETYKPIIHRSGLKMPDKSTSPISSVEISNKTSQQIDNKGKEFWLLMERNYTGVVDGIFLDITSEINTTGTVEISGLSFLNNFDVIAGQITRVTLPDDVQIMTSEQVENKGIHVVSDAEITIYGLSHKQYTSDAFLGLPLDILSTQYLVASYPNSTRFSTREDALSQFAIVCPYDGVTVTITPSTSTLAGKPANQEFQIILNKGEVYQVRSALGQGNDLTGSVVQSTLPVAVFSGSSIADVPWDANIAAADHIIQQMPPTSTWGSSFVTYPLEGRENGDTYRFLSSQNNTELNINDQLVATLNFGDYYECILTSPAVISATNPILVLQYSNGDDWDNNIENNGDPFMMIIPPTEQFMNNYNFATPNEGFASNYVTITIASEGISSLLLDGVQLNNEAFMPIGNSGFSGAGISLEIGSHSITNTSGYPFGIYSYGFAGYDSYGYPGGLSLEYIYEGSAPIISRTEETINLSNQAQVEGIAIPISVNITDSEEPYTQAATLFYRQVSNENYTEIPMINTTNNIWAADIPSSTVLEPGLKYYIYATDGQLSSTSPSISPSTNAFNIAVLPNQLPNIEHSNITHAESEQEIIINASIIDETYNVESAQLLYRKPGGNPNYISLPMVNTGGNNYSATIPSTDVTLQGIEYYINATDDLGLSSSHGEVDNPHEILVYNPGTTVIVHGLDFLGFVGERSLDDNAQWTLTMAQAIANRIGNGQVYTLIDGILSHRTDYSVGTGGENIIVFDWLDESDRATFGYSEGAGDALASFLIKYADDGIISLDQLHFIGHSRGSVVCSEAIQRLNLFRDNSDLSVDGNIHFTTLDPHPWDEKKGDEIGDPGWASDHDVNGSQIDFGVVAWDIVSYVDNYWHKGDGLNGLSSFPGCLDIKNNKDLSNKDGNYSDMDHSGIHAWYHGTVDFDAETDEVNEDPITINPDNSWYPGIERKSLGFNYVSSIGGDLNSIQSENTVSIYDDETLSLTTIFNGNFSKNGYWWYKKYWIPGWESHNGGGRGFINLDYVNYRLKLNDNNDSRTHNSLFISQGMEGIYFRYRVSNKSNDDHLVVKLNNVKLDQEFPLDDRSLTYINTSVGIPGYAGSVNTLTFQIESKEGGVNSTVYIDDISFQILRYFSASVASPVNLHAYDSYGNHTGPTSDSTWVAEIPNSKYIIIGDSADHSKKSIILPPLADGNEYSFRIESLDTTAHFGFYLEDNSYENKTSIATFDSVLIEPNTVATTTINHLNSNVLLAVDLEGDGNFETSLPPDNYFQNMHIFASIEGNGTIEPSDDIIVNYGDTLTTQIIPDSGYAISNVLVDSDSIGKVTSYTFSNVISDHTIHAIFISTTGIGDEKFVPKSFYLNQNYPNPFNPETKISFGLPNSSKVKIDVYNSLGQHLSTLINKQMLPGHHIVTFDGSSLPSGVYFYRIITGKNSKIKKMLILK